MPEVAKRLAGPLLVPAAPGTIYTVPALTTTILRHLRVSNGWAAGVPLTMSVGADAAGTRILQNQPVHPNDLLEWSGWEVLNAGDVLQANCQPPLLSAPAFVFWATAATGGSLAASTTYYYVATATNAQGETTISNEAAITTGSGTSTNTNTLWFSVPPGATNIRIYRGTAAGAENVYYQFAALTSNSPFADTGAAATSGSPPATNTAQVFSLVLTASGVEVS